MNTNFYAIEVCSAAHDAEQLKAMRQARMPRNMCAACASLFETLTRFFSQSNPSAVQPAAAANSI